MIVINSNNKNIKNINIVIKDNYNNYNINN